MAIERRRGASLYYYRSRKVAGRGVREYVGAGELALAVAELDRAERAERQAARELLTAELEAHAELGAEVAEVADAVDRLVALALLAAGLHRHDRGTWRRRATA